MSDFIENIASGDIMGAFNISCGSKIIASCENLSIPWGEDWTFEMLVGDLVDAASILLKFGVQYLFSDASENMMRGINSLRCFITSAGDNIWNFVAAAYWTVATFGVEAEILPYLDEAYQHVCTCQEDARNIAE